MVDQGFLDYIEKALKQYEEYHKQDGVQKLEFSDFLTLIQIWKTEELLEKFEDKE